MPLSNSGASKINEQSDCFSGIIHLTDAHVETLEPFDGHERFPCGK
jgi:hypothetical protein